MPPKLLIQSNEGTVQEVIFDRPRITIGRKPANDLHFNRPEISGNHAEFVSENEQFFITDLGSTNGTLMNGAKLLPHQRYALQDGDLILIAPVRIQFSADKESTDTVTDVDVGLNSPRAGSGTMIDIAHGKISTGTEEHKKEAASPPPPQGAAAPAPPPAPEAPKPAPAAAPPPPPPVPAAQHPEAEPLPEEQAPPPIEAPSKSMTDYLWLGLGALFLLLAIGLIAYLLTL